MVDIEANSGNDQHEPTSIFGQALIRKNLSSQVLFWLSSTSLIASGLLGLYNFFNPSIIIYERSVLSYEVLCINLYVISLGIIIFHFQFNRSLYIKYLDVYNTIIDSNLGSVSTEFERKRNKINQFFIIIAIFYEILTSSIVHHQPYLAKHGFSMGFYVKLLVMSVSLCGYVFSIQFIIECCIYSQSSLMSIHNLLDFLLNQQIESPLNNLNQIAKPIRLYYKKTIDSIRLMDRFLNFAIFIFYFYFTGHCIFIVGEILEANHHSVGSTLWLIFRFFGETSYVVLITYHLLGVHQNSTQIFEKVYELSCFLDSSHRSNTANEINLFLLRTNRNDVGFTFAGLCMVSPSFVSSLATISLTLGLALPSFMK